MPVSTISQAGLDASIALTTPIITTTMGVGNATPAASGAGITFPATQSASSDVNTLDDYEEGTWSPVLIPTTGTITAQTSSGRYIKIGKHVTVTFSMFINSGTVTAINEFSGLPFTIENTVPAPVGASRENSVTGYMWEVIGSINTNTAALRRYDQSSTVTNVYGWIGTFTYFTTS
jgi:hypothetical protein